MIQRIKDSGKFICNVISVTGKTLKQVEFNSFEEACKYRREMIKKNTIEDVEIYTPNNTAIACEDDIENKVEDKVEDVKIEDLPEEQEKCCICGGELGEYGNNPEPISKEGQCCEACNSNFVVPSRLIRQYRPHQKLLFVTCSNCNMPVILASMINTCKCGKKYDIQGNEVAENTQTSVSDAREFIGEYIDEYYDRYRGITIFKKKINNIEYEFKGTFLEEEFKDKTFEGLKEKLDKAIEKYVEGYTKNFEFKKGE